MAKQNGRNDAKYKTQQQNKVWWAQSKKRLFHKQVIDLWEQRKPKIWKR